jgi:outer membrane protein TolC
MNWKKATRIVGVLCVPALGLACKSPEARPFDPVAMQRMFRDRAGENVTYPPPQIPLSLDKEFLVKREANPASRPAPVPTTAQSFGPAIRMSLRDLIRLAAINSLQVRVQNYQPSIDEARVIEAEARFDPTFFTNLNFATQTILSPTPQTLATNTSFQTTTLETGFKQQLPTGAEVALTYRGTQTFRTGTNFQNPTSFGEPLYESGLNLQITQPLLRNAGVEVNRARIVVARNTQRVSLLDARLQLEKTISEIEEAYWQLVQAERELAIQEKLYNETVDTAIILQLRVGQDVTRVQLGQTNAALRNRAVALVDARYQLKRLSHEIKRRVNDPSMPVASSVLILPDDEPIQAPIKFDLAEQIEAGLTNRAELSQQQIRIDSASVIYKAAQNNLLPQLNLVGSIGTKGAGPYYHSALRNELYDNQAQEYAIGFQLEVPLGNREARAILTRTHLQRQQAIDQYKDLIEQVTLDVRTAYDQVYNAWERLTTTRQAVFAARDALDAILQEEKVGQTPLTPDFVNRKLNAQEVLAQAAREDARAVSDYNTAISALERAKGTILKYDNILMQQEPMVTGAGGMVSRKMD